MIRNLTAAIGIGAVVAVWAWSQTLPARPEPLCRVAAHLVFRTCDEFRTYQRLQARDKLAGPPVVCSANCNDAVK